MHMWAGTPTRGEGASQCDIEGELRFVWSFTDTQTFMSRNMVFVRTVAPASRHTLASERSGPTSLALSLPERGMLRGVSQRHPDCPALEKGLSHQQGEAKSFKHQCAEQVGSTLNSVAVGATQNTPPAPGLP